MWCLLRPWSFVWDLCHHEIRGWWWWWWWWRDTRELGCLSCNECWLLDNRCLQATHSIEVTDAPTTLWPCCQFARCLVTSDVYFLLVGVGKSPLLSFFPLFFPPLTPFLSFFLSSLFIPSPPLWLQLGSGIECSGFPSGTSPGTK